MLRIIPSADGAGYGLMRIGPDTKTPGAVMHLVGNQGDASSGLRLERTSATASRYNFFIEADGDFVLNNGDGIGDNLTITQATGLTTFAAGITAVGTVISPRLNGVAGALGIEGPPNGRYMVAIGGAGDTAFAPTTTGANDIAGLQFRPASITAAAGNTGDVSSLLVKTVDFVATDGTHALGASGAFYAPSKSGGGVFTSMATLYVDGPPSGGGTNNWSVRVPSGVASFGGTVNSALYATATNCADSAGAAACGSAAAGHVVIDAGATSVVVSTTAVTAASQIPITFDSSLGALLSVTCNTTAALPYITARTAGVSFTMTIAVAPAANPACYGYGPIVN